MQVPIKLTPEVVAYGRRKGAERTARARAIGRSEPHGKPADPEEYDMEAVCAEIAVGLFLGIEWEVKTDPDKGGDVGNVEVRWTQYSNGHLITHDDDRPECPFVLVTGEKGDYVLRGWMMGYDAMNPKYQNHPKARSPEDYWAPQADFEPMETL